ncbi:MAG TPA: tRNA uridine-5-carboxymethylaminomethyl(34) synthesis GTPase MnmE, partial [Flavobacteriales bacterium]|nr:tRNA uridine-5-carboxymethylaminomethyl(34) synthesis GTPase MnmE [Flavobacteriales bacterium]
MHLSETIAALSTAPGVGAIALLRLSGPKAYPVVERLAPSLPLEPLARHAYFVPLIDLDGQIDEAVITFFPGPNSYTGEDLVEVSVHGSTY